MRVINNEKARARIYIRNNIQSCITNITSESNSVYTIMAAISNAMSGSVVGTDHKLRNDCSLVLSDISQALELLYRCIELTDQLDITEEIPDDQY